MPYKYIVHVYNQNSNPDVHSNFHSYFYNAEDAIEFYNQKVDEAVLNDSGNQVCIYRLMTFDRTFL